MTKLSILIPVYIFLLNELSAQTNDTSVFSKQEVKKFVANIKHKDIDKGLICLCDHPYVLKEADIAYYATSADIHLGKQDDEFIKSQFEQTKNLLWDKSLIDSAILISQDNINSIFKIRDKNEAWKVFRKKYKHNFYRMSVPIFTKDMQYCFIKIDYFCGSFCGTYLVNIYKREGNEWRLYKNVEYGIS